MYQEIRANQQAFSDIFAWDSGYTNMRIGEGTGTRQAFVIGVTGEFFATPGVSSASGRLLGSEDDFRGCPLPVSS